MITFKKRLAIDKLPPLWSVLAVLILSALILACGETTLTPPAVTDALPENTKLPDSTLSPEQRNEAPDTTANPTHLVQKLTPTATPNPTTRVSTNPRSTTTSPIQSVVTPVTRSDLDGYLVIRQVNSGDLYQITEDEAQLVATDVRHPELAPNGRSLAYSIDPIDRNLSSYESAAVGESTFVVVRDMVTGHGTVLFNDYAECVKWSPDSGTFAYVGSRGLEVATMSGWLRPVEFRGGAFYESDSTARRFVEFYVDCGTWISKETLIFQRVGDRPPSVSSDVEVYRQDLSTAVTIDPEVRRKRNVFIGIPVSNSNSQEPTAEMLWRSTPEDLSNLSFTHLSLSIVGSSSDKSLLLNSPDGSRKFFFASSENLNKMTPSNSKFQIEPVPCDVCLWIGFLRGGNTIWYVEPTTGGGLQLHLFDSGSVQKFDIEIPPDRIEFGVTGLLLGDSRERQIAVLEEDDGKNYISIISLNSGEKRQIVEVIGTDWEIVAWSPAGARWSPGLPGDPYADEVLFYKPQNLAGLGIPYTDPREALGAPDAVSRPQSFYSYGKGLVSLGGEGGILDVQFTDNSMIDGPGDDLVVIQAYTGLGSPSPVEGQDEKPYEVFVSFNNEWHLLGSGFGTTGFDLATLGNSVGQVTTVRIVDHSKFNRSSLGLIIDAVIALNVGPPTGTAYDPAASPHPTPVPTAVLPTTRNPQLWPMPKTSERIKYGQTLSGRLEVTVIVDAYTFRAEPGDVALIKVTPRMRMHVYDESGEFLCESTSYSDIECDLEQGGLISIQVMRFHEYTTEVQEYTIHLQRSNDPVDRETLEYDRTKQGSLNLLAQVDFYEFVATARDIIVVDRSSDIDLLVEIFGPAGDLVCANRSEACFLNDTGTHIVKVAVRTGLFSGGKVGPYSLTIKNESPNN